MRKEKEKRKDKERLRDKGAAKEGKTDRLARRKTDNG
jgi:hypothetical protein